MTEHQSWNIPQGKNLHVCQKDYNLQKLEPTLISILIIQTVVSWYFGIVPLTVGGQAFNEVFYVSVLTGKALGFLLYILQEHH